MYRKRAILIFPPNWSACTSSPHLALPLLVGASRKLDWYIETWDLSEQFYRIFSIPPSRNAIFSALSQADFNALDELYFNWEDQLRSIPSFAREAVPFRLLSGYRLSKLRSLPLEEVKRLVQKGTVYTPFFVDNVLPKLVQAEPSVVGVTIASQNQMVPAIELLQLLRQSLPETYIILGGNIITRLRDSSAFKTLTSLADQVVLFQGEMAFYKILSTVDKVGVKKSREYLPSVVSEINLPYVSWPTPVFDGISFEHYVGIPVLPYVSTRGCYWGKCDFCAIPAGWSPKGYAGSAPCDFVAGQLAQMVMETGIPRVKFVDEAFLPRKVLPLCNLLHNAGINLEWEAYARLEPDWENATFLDKARDGGLRKLYFGLEQAPSKSRELLGKNDLGDPLRILKACANAGVEVHLFCMVGYPGTSREDAKTTVQFLLENEPLVDTADLVGFHFDCGTKVKGIRPIRNSNCDWRMSIPYEPTCSGILSAQEVSELEIECQEILWSTVPRFLHPLYRTVGPWKNGLVTNKDFQKPEEIVHA